MIDDLDGFAQLYVAAKGDALSVAESPEHAYRFAEGMIKARAKVLEELAADGFEEVVAGGPTEVPPHPAIPQDGAEPESPEETKAQRTFDQSARIAGLLRAFPSIIERAREEGRAELALTDEQLDAIEYHAEMVIFGELQ